MTTNVFLRVLDQEGDAILKAMDDFEIASFEKEISKTLKEMVDSMEEGKAKKGFHIINMVVNTTVYNIQMAVDVKSRECVFIDVISLKVMNMDEFLDFLNEFRNLENSTDPKEKQAFFLKCMKQMS